VYYKNDLFFISTNGFNTLPIAIGTASKYKRLFPFNASWACLAGQAGLPRGNLLIDHYSLSNMMISFGNL